VSLLFQADLQVNLDFHLGIVMQCLPNLCCCCTEEFAPALLKGKTVVQLATILGLVVKNAKVAAPPTAHTSLQAYDAPRLQWDACSVCRFLVIAAQL
jgi:hypothetical protein